MKKLRTLFTLPVLMLTGSLWAQSMAPSGFQFGPYVAYNQGLGSVTDHEAGNIAGGLDVYYQLPLNLPEYVPFSNLGFSVSGDFGTAIGKKDYIEKWNVSTLTAGVWFDWNLLPAFKLRPEARYGAAINMVESKSRNVSGVQVDQIVKLGGVVVWEPVFMRGFALYGGADYSLMPEKDNTGNFVGVKAGVLYRPENSYKKIKAAQKAAAEQEALALEAQKKLDAEKQRQADLEKARLEAEEKARLAQEQADAETLAKLQAEKEALEAQLKEAEEKAKAAEEAARLAAEKAAAEKAEAERLAAEEKARLEAEAKAKTVKVVEVKTNEDGSVDIAIPTLTFKSDSSELTDSKKNAETLNKLYEILSDETYAGFKCDVTGFVNPDNYIWTEAEKQLAMSRANTVVEYLKAKGIPAERFTTNYGSGKTSNKEYNRRVEFKLTK